MRFVSRLISTLFNPIYIPLLGAILYFVISPKFTPERTRKLVLLAILIITVVIPYIFYLLLRNLGWVTHNNLSEVKERKIPLYLCIIVTYITLIKVTPTSLSYELYFFFVGILGTLISCLIMVYLNFKASMHMMGICGLTTFMVGLSVHFEINLTTTIAFLILSAGAVATARLHLQHHRMSEIVIGALIGIIPQFILFSYWL